MLFMSRSCDNTLSQREASSESEVECLECLRPDSLCWLPPPLDNDDRDECFVIGSIDDDENALLCFFVRRRSVMRLESLPSLSLPPLKLRDLDMKEKF